MYKVLLADDEGIAIDALTFIINQSFKDECEIRSAKTGRSVIEIAEAFNPDIAIMDIQMPGINGIEAIKEIRRFSPSTIFIIVSAFDRFNYAKEAINLGVLEYLTKPLDKDIFTDTMKKAIHLINKEKEKRSTELRNWEKLETVIPVIENGFVYSVLLSDNSSPNIPEYMNLLEITADFAAIMVIEFGDSPEEIDKSRPGKTPHLQNEIGTGIRIQNYYSKIRNIVKEFFAGAIIGSIMGNRIAVFLPEKSSSLEYNERIQMIEKVRTLISKLNEKTGASFRAGIGSIKPLRDVSASYREALDSLKEGSDMVSHADDLPVACAYESDYPIDLERIMFDHVAAGDVSQTTVDAENYFDWMANTHADMTDSIRLKSLEFVLWAEHIAYENGAKGRYKFGSRSDYMSLCMNSSIKELHKWFVDKIIDASRCVVTKKETQAENLIDTAKEYIYANYSSDISLDDVSRQINISPFYFSKLFKEEVGVNFIDYLTTLRLDKAKELLLSSSLSVKEICNQVGYQDPNYFSRIFKKSTGHTPTEFKDTQQN